MTHRIRPLQRCSRLAGMLALLAALLIQAGAAAAFETRARAAWVLDQTTDVVLLERNADVPLPPASMSKLMTLYLLFEALRDGRVSMETEFRVSARAHAMGGSKMFLREGERVKIRDLIPGIIVHSGNDACVVVAEGLAGSEEAFVRLMNRRARQIGLRHSSFANANGWPAPNHRMSAEDLGHLARRIIEDFPEFYPFFAQQEFTWARITQRNRNPLLGRVAGADGLKTGHTEEAGYGLVGSAERDGRRVTFVIMGLESAAARADEGERILNWAFHQFSLRTLVPEGHVVGEAPVWLGASSRVPLVPREAIRLPIPATARGPVTARILLEGPVEAPVKAGQELATLIIDLPDLGEIRRPLVAAEDVPAGGFTVRVTAAARILAGRLMQRISGP